VLEKIGIGRRRCSAISTKKLRSCRRFRVVLGAAAFDVGGGQSAIGEVVQGSDGFKDEYVSTEHMLLALTSLKNDPAQELLARHGATHDAILRALTAVRGSQRITDQNPEAKYQALERYARDLTELARRGKLDPVIGRDEEVRRVVQVLSRRTKNNPVLIGEPGVGRPHRRGTGAAHYFGRCTGGSEEQALVSLDLARCWRARNIAANLKTG